MDFLGLIVNLITMATFLFSGYSVILGLRAKKELAGKEMIDNEQIKIVLVNENQKIVIPYMPKRKNLTRPEIAGILGMFTNGKRYDLPNLGQLFYDGTFDNVISGKISTIEISCSKETYDIFDKCIKVEYYFKKGGETND